MLHGSIEIYPNILSSHFYFNYVPGAHSTVSSLKVLCSTSDLKILFLNEENIESSFSVNFPEDMFITSSFSTTTTPETFNVKIEHNSITMNHFLKPISTNTKKTATAFNFRLQLDKIDASFLKIELPLSVLQYFQNSINFNCYYNIMCSYCNSIQSSKPIKFQNVREYCLNSELSENWFCHSSQETLQQLSCDNLYVDNVAFYFPSSVVESFNLNMKGEDLNCNNCSQVLSTKKFGKSFLKFYIDKLLLQAVEETCREQAKNKINLSILSVGNMINAAKNLNCKIFLQSKPPGGGEPCCLLLRVPSGPVQQFMLTFSSSLQEAGATTFAPVPVYKVLYQVAPPSSPECRDWLTDFAVDFYEVSPSMMASLVAHLELSAAHLGGEEARRVREFECGCLPLITEDWLG